MWVQGREKRTGREQKMVERDSRNEKNFFMKVKREGIINGQGYDWYLTQREVIQGEGPVNLAIGNNWWP